MKNFILIKIVEELAVLGHLYIEKTACFKFLMTTSRKITFSLSFNELCKRKKIIIVLCQDSL